MVEGAQGLSPLVFVDDAHLLGGTAVLVHQTVLTQVATVSAGDVLPDPALPLWKDGPVERIEIGILDDETIEKLLATALWDRWMRRRCESWPDDPDVFAGAGQRWAR
jgi:hypothetical protein